MEWPGNVRELENVIERAVLLTRGSVLQLSLPEVTLPEEPCPPPRRKEGEDEYQLIMRVLKETNGVVAGPKGAAQRLGLKRTTLLSRMKRLGLIKRAWFNPQSGGVFWHRLCHPAQLSLIDTKSFPLYKIPP
jgi:formate hydrogenlyase transcriptional activator